ncbi:MAG: hypothetical protein K8S56_06805, partial [Candidatus Cloacimonetes bacterium]|nr:hypothetical protein [Candidatus Cloacimonadota bacterium]
KARYTERRNTDKANTWTGIIVKILLLVFVVAVIRTFSGDNVEHMKKIFSRPPVIQQQSPVKR